MNQIVPQVMTGNCLDHSSSDDYSAKWNVFDGCVSVNDNLTMPWQQPGITAYVSVSRAGNLMRCVCVQLGNASAILLAGAAVYRMYALTVR